MALAKGMHCQLLYHILLARIQSSSTLKEKKLKMPGAAQGCITEGLGGLGKNILTSAIRL